MSLDISAAPATPFFSDFASGLFSKKLVQLSQAPFSCCDSLPPLDLGSRAERVTQSTTADVNVNSNWPNTLTLSLPSATIIVFNLFYQPIKYTVSGNGMCLEHLDLQNVLSQIKQI